METRLSEEKQTFKCIDKPDIPLESFIGSFPSEYLDSEDALIVYENGEDEIVLYQSVNENSSPTKDTPLPTKDTSQLVVKGEERQQLLQYINKYAHVADCRVIKEEFVCDEVLPSMNLKNSISGTQKQKVLNRDLINTEYGLGGENSLFEILKSEFELLFDENADWIDEVSEKPVKERLSIRQRKLQMRQKQRQRNSHQRRRPQNVASKTNKTKKTTTKATPPKTIRVIIEKSQLPQHKDGKEDGSKSSETAENSSLESEAVDTPNHDHGNGVNIFKKLLGTAEKSQFSQHQVGKQDGSKSSETAENSSLESEAVDTPNHDHGEGVNIFKKLLGIIHRKKEGADDDSEQFSI